MKSFIELVGKHLKGKFVTTTIELWSNSHVLPCIEMIAQYLDIDKNCSRITNKKQQIMEYTFWIFL